MPKDNFETINMLTSVALLCMNSFSVSKPVPSLSASSTIFWTLDPKKKKYKYRNIFQMQKIYGDTLLNYIVFLF